ncbi:MAG: MFS transporter, partial [Cyanobacteria bacterium P01_F01_bin.3]
PLVKRMGKKKALQLSMLWAGGGLMLLAMGSVWLGPSFLLLLLLPLGSLGLGCFYILPNAMLPDVIEQDERLGKSAEAVYFGSRGLFAELSIGIGTLVVGLLLSLGKTAAEPSGVQLSLLVAGLFALASAALLVAYPIDK